MDLVDPAGTLQSGMSPTLDTEDEEDVQYGLCFLVNYNEDGIYLDSCLDVSSAIGNGQANHLVMTANHRAWRHVIEMRTSVHAEEEIRVIMSDVAQQLKDKFPTIYGDMDKNGVDEWVFANSKV